MESLKNFVTMVQYSDLPDEVIHEIKRLFLDSIGCAIAGLKTERGKIAVNFAGKLGGTPESTIIGTNNKVSCTNAAFVNGELINALEFEPISEVAPHDVPCLIAAILAVAERREASGKDLILAAAICLEISARLELAIAQISPVVEELDKGSIQYPAVSGFANASLAASAGTSRLMNLDSERIANAIGICGCICPPNIARKFFDTSPVRMTRYGSSGWAAQAGITSALLAEMGYTGDTDLFEGEYGFWKYNNGQDQALTLEKVFADYETAWYSRQISYKRYPAGYCIAGVLDEFIQIMEENDIKPEEIEVVNAKPSPIAQFTYANANKLRTLDDYFYSIPYTLACAAYRIKPTHWHDANVMQDPRIQKFIHRVEFNINIDENDYVMTKIAEPRSDLQGVDIVARGKIYSGKVPSQKGRWYKDELRNTDEELIEKFMDNSLRSLPLEKVNNVRKNILGLENLGNVAQLMQIFIP